MKLYKVLIVDDDSIVRMGLKSSADWRSHGFLIAGEASNGKEALVLMDKLKPDLVLTDVYMPEYDGIAFIKEAKKHYPDTIFVVLSCHDNIEYVKESIKLGIYDYLLKSQIVNSNLLNQTLDHIYHTISESCGLKKSASNFNSIEYGLSAYLHGDGSAAQQLLFDMKKNGVINSEETFFMIGITLFSNAQRSVQDHTAYDTIQRVVDKATSAQHYSYITKTDQNFIILLNITSASHFITIENKALSICEWIRVNLNNDLKTACQILLSPKTSFHDLPSMFLYMAAALDKNSSIGTSNITVLGNQTEQLVSNEEESQKTVDPLSLVLNYLYTHYQEKIVLDKLAKLANFSRFYLCKKFREQTGVSIFDFLTDIRINKAKELLMNSDKRIFEISHDIGYDDTPYFNRTFKKHTGMTPKEYAAKYKI